MKPVLPNLVDIELSASNITGGLNSSLQNFTGSVTKPLSSAELAGLVVTGIIGLIGAVLNSGVLFIVYKGRLVKKDYRMLYYIFITVGDLLFAVHTIINSLSILYRDFHMFKIFVICLNLQVTLGVVTYQWSAMCIILLLIDLVWSLRNPFCDDRPKKRFSKIACICAFLLGIVSGLLPFAFFDDLPDELAFCSVANVYGKHWIFAIREATGVLSALIGLMIGATVYLMVTMYRAQRPWRIRNLESRTSSAIEDEKEDVPEIPVVITRSTSQNVSLSSAWREASDGTNCNSIGSMDIWATQNNDDVFTSNNQIVPYPGIDNQAFSAGESDANTSVALPELADTPGRKTKMEDHMVMQDVQSKQFVAACRTVAVFMATYLGSCLPYYILLLINIHCEPDCNQDTPEQRVIRVIVAAFLYLLPVLDPILYTKRFTLFKQAALDVLKPCRLNRSTDSTAGLTWRS